MTDSRSGRLYSSRGASHPEAVPALPGDERDHVPSTASKRVKSRRSRLTGAQAFSGVLALVVSAVLVDDMLFSGPGLISTVVFVVVGVLGALLVDADGAWAGWTAPPIALLAGLFLSGMLNSGAGVIGAAITVVEGLAANVWPVLGVLVISLQLGRRHQLFGAKPSRKSKREAL